MDLRMSSPRWFGPRRRLLRRRQHPRRSLSCAGRGDCGMPASERQVLRRVAHVLPDLCSDEIILSKRHASTSRHGDRAAVRPTRAHAPRTGARM